MILAIIFIPVIFLVVLLSKGLVQIIFAATCSSCAWLSTTTLFFDGISPIGGSLSCIHFWEEKSKDCFSVRPIQIIQLHCHLLVWLRRTLLRFKVLLWKLGSGLDKWQKFWLLHGLGTLQFSLQFPSLFFFDLLHRFEEKLFNVRSLIKNHLRNSFQIAALNTLHSYWFVQIFEFFVLFANNLLVLEF